MPTEFTTTPGTTTLTDLTDKFSRDSGVLKGTTLPDGSVKVYEGKTGVGTLLGLKSADPKKQLRAREVLHQSIEQQYSKDMAERLFREFHVGKTTAVSGELIHKIQDRAVELSSTGTLGSTEAVSSLRDVAKATGMETFEKLGSVHEVRDDDLCITVFPMRVPRPGGGEKAFGAGHVAFYDGSKTGHERWRDKGSTATRNDAFQAGATFVRIADRELSTRVRGMLDARHSAMPFMSGMDMTAKGAGPFIKTFMSAHTELKTERPKVLEHTLVDMSYYKAHEWAQQRIEMLDAQRQPTRDREALRSTLFNIALDVKIALQKSPAPDALLALNAQLEDAFDKLPGAPYADRPDTSVIDTDTSLSPKQKIEQKKKLLDEKITEMYTQMRRDEAAQEPIKKEIRELELFCQELSKPDSWKTLHPDEPGIYCSSFTTRMLQSAQLSLELEPYLGRELSDTPYASLAHAVEANVEALTRGIKEKLQLQAPDPTAEPVKSAEAVKARVDETVTTFMRSDAVDKLFSALPKGMDITPRASPHTVGAGASTLSGDECFKTRARPAATFRTD